MAFQPTDDSELLRDDEGRVRLISQVAQPFRPPETAFGSVEGTRTPRDVAEGYIKEMAGVLEFAPSQTSNFAAESTSSPTEAGSELRFREEKPSGDMTAVTYAQTIMGLPVWNAGVTVRINTGPMSVSGVQNEVHYDVGDITMPPGDARYLPFRIDPDALLAVLGLKERGDLEINATRMWIYQFDPLQRVDPQIAAHADNEGAAFGPEAPRHFPSIDLPPVSDSIAPGRHFIVTEVLFTMTAGTWGRLNWRAFIEPASGEVLYLRALVSCASGAVFTSDPITLSGQLHSADTAANVLDALRATVPLTVTPVADGALQSLLGDFVRLSDVDAPNVTMPTAGPPYNFAFTCKSDDFSACSAYYHCDAFFRLIEEMGIPVASYFNNTDFPVPVDPHALGGVVNAQARGNRMGNGMGAFVFGAAKPGTNVGIAADVRVVIHEFGHALLWDHVNSPNFGFAHSAGDTLAVLLHDPETKAPDRFETFPFMKASAGLSRRHDRDVVAGWAWGGPRWNSQYGGEEVLSTTLFRVYRAAGGDSNDVAVRKFASRYVSFLIVKAIGLLSFMSADARIFVTALTEADATTINFEGHGGGAFGKVLRWSFERQGLYQPPGAPRPFMTPGAPPDVDVYIDDGRRGEYMPFLKDFRGMAEVWNRRTADAGTTHEAPAVGANNFVYASIRNRGTKPATGIKITLFQARNGPGANWPTDWKPQSTSPLTLANMIPPAGSVVAGPIPWRPDFAQQMVLLSVSATGDLSTVDIIGPRAMKTAVLVSLENNVAVREM